MPERLHFRFSLSCIGEGNGSALQYSCLENPRDGGAWWAAVYGVAQSRTLAIRGFLYFHTNCKIICSSSVKNTVGSLIGVIDRVPEELWTEVHDIV